jgi:putative redox protein
VTWRGGQRFDAGRPGGIIVRLDGDAVTGPGPMDALLSALASCTSIDVVSILEKRRTPVSSLEVEVHGARVDGTPRKLKHVQLTFRISGAGIDRATTERTIELSLTKYCSVRDSLDPSIPIEWTLELGDGTGIGTP